MINANPGRQLVRSAQRKLDPWRERGLRLLWALRINRPESQRPLPPVKIELAHAVPGWLLRLVGLVAGAGSLVALGPSVPLLVLGAVALLFWLIRPGGVAVAAYTVLVGVILLVDLDLFAPAGFVAAAAVHLLLALSSFLGPAAWSARIEVSALRPVMVRFVVIQVIAQTLGLAGRLISTLQLNLPVLPLLAGAALVGFVVWLWPRRRSRGWQRRGFSSS